MLAFMMSVEQLELFYQICEAVGAVTEEQKVFVAMEMAQHGHINSVVKTKMDKEEYVKHLAKNFGNVLVVKPQEKDKNGDSTDIGFKL